MKRKKLLGAVLLLIVIIIAAFFYNQHKNSLQMNSDGELCGVPLTARNIKTGETKDFKNNCDIPDGWEATTHIAR